jgi:hypothetical protein
LLNKELTVNCWRNVDFTINCNRLKPEKSNCDICSVHLFILFSILSGSTAVIDPGIYYRATFKVAWVLALSGVQGLSLVSGLRGEVFMKLNAPGRKNTISLLEFFSAFENFRFHNALYDPQEVASFSI